MENKILVLDVDGVLLDSKIDGMITAFNVYLKFYPNTKLFGGEAFDLDNVNTKIKKFSTIVSSYDSMRAFSRNVYDIFILIKALDEGLSINSFKDLDNITKKISKDNLEKFAEGFFKQRKNFMSVNFDKWAELSKPYKAILEATKKLVKDGKKIGIVSNKNKEAIIRLLSYYGLALNKSEIIDKDFGNDKAEKLRLISEKRKIPLNNILFVDDILEHVVEVNKIGVKCYLAGWGYNNEQQRKEAKKQGITVLNQDEFYNVISRALE